jgi:hypothetical protein
VKRQNRFPRKLKNKKTKHAQRSTITRKTKFLFHEIDKKFDTSVGKILGEMFPTTSKNILRQNSEDLSRKVMVHKNFRYQAIARGVESEADIFFLMQCVFSSMRSTFLMLALFKEEDNVGSWHKLIDAHDYIDIAIRIAEKYVDDPLEILKIRETHGLWEIKRRLNEFERTLFRPQKLFNSSGMVETIGNCSICGLPFHECDHVEGDIVMGRLCRRVNRSILRADHSALVEHPKDKRCVFTTTFNSRGVSIDFFSREPLKEPKDKNVYEGILHVLADLDLD